MEFSIVLGSWEITLAQTLLLPVSTGSTRPGLPSEEDFRRCFRGRVACPNGYAPGRTTETDRVGATVESDMRGELSILKSAPVGVGIVRTEGSVDAARANRTSSPAASSRALRRPRFADGRTAARTSPSPARVCCVAANARRSSSTPIFSNQGRSLRHVHASPSILPLPPHPHRRCIEQLLLSAVDADATAMWDLDLPWICLGFLLPRPCPRLTISTVHSLRSTRDRTSSTVRWILSDPPT